HRGGGGGHQRGALLLRQLGQHLRPRLGEVMRQRGVLDDEHLGRVLARVGRGGLGARPDQDERDRAVVPRGLAREGDAGEGGAAQVPVGVLGEQEDFPHQSTFASLWSFATSSSTDATLIPALRAGGASIATVLTTGVADTPSAASVVSAIGFFFAAMIP